MTAVGELVLVLGLLVSAHCEVRARDPEVEEEEEELGARGGGGGPAFPGGPGATETPLRTGNWCAFVQKRVVTMAVACGTEQYTIKSQSPCPSGMPDCHLIMYKQSTRPMYKQKQTIVTALLWRCCPGHRGHNCEDTEAGPQLDSENSALIGQSEPNTAEVKAPDVHTRPLQRHSDPNREQNDRGPVSAVHDSTYPSTQHNTTQPPVDPGHTPNFQHTSDQAEKSQNQRQDKQQKSGVDDQSASPLSYHNASSVLPVPHMMALVWSQLQPVLQGFNRSLEHLSRQVGDLARDVAQLKSSQLEARLVAREEAKREQAAEDARLDKVFQDISEVRKQMEDHQAEMQNRLHSQHAMLNYNLTSFKTDIDMKLKRHQKTLQVSLQAMNTTLSELKLDQKQITEEMISEVKQDDLHPPTLPLHWPTQPPTDTSALWKAIKHLNNMVGNNTEKMNQVKVILEDVKSLMPQIDKLEKLINHTARRSQVLFMETGLEVESAKVLVLNQVNELARNLSLQEKKLHKTEDNVDLLFPLIYNASADCNCNGLKAAVAHLEKCVINLTELARENRLALDEYSKEEVGSWDRASEFEQAVEVLQRDLSQEQSRIRTLDLSLTQLNSSVSALKETDRQQKVQIQVLFNSFSSLHADTGRHSRTLELLLGEEVLDFVEGLEQQEEEEEESFISVPALKEELRHLQEQLRSHPNYRWTGGREEVPADQPSSSFWLPGDTRRGGDGGLPARELLLHPGDGGDLWNLEKTVEKMKHRLVQLEEKPCSCPNTSTAREAPPEGEDTKLQEDVMWLKTRLEEHLRVFQNVFSNADVLEKSDATLELDKLWRLLKNKNKEKKKRGGRREESAKGGNHRNRRESPGEPIPAGLSERSLLFVARSPRSVPGKVMFEPCLDRGHFSSDSGTFTAPVNGIYLFILTLDLKPGHTHVVLRKRRKEEEEGGASVSLQRQEVIEAGTVTGVSLLLLKEGEELRLELRGGEWVESESNVFAGLLVHMTT